MASFATQPSTCTVPRVLMFSALLLVTSASNAFAPLTGFDPSPAVPAWFSKYQSLAELVTSS